MCQEEAEVGHKNSRPGVGGDGAGWGRGEPQGEAALSRGVPRFNLHFRKTIPAAAASIFSCIIHLNTCLTIRDRAQSWKGEAPGTPKDSFSTRFYLLVSIHPAAKKGLSLKSGSAHTTHLVERCVHGNTSSVTFLNALKRAGT